MTWAWEYIFKPSGKLLNGVQMFLIQIHKPIHHFAILLMLFVSLLSSHEANANEENYASVESVEILKRDLLDLNKELFILEEELLFPANTQVAIFISQDSGTAFKMDHAKVLLDNKAVNYHLYTESELDALSRGAVHRIHTINLNQGDHKLVIIFGGFGPKGREYKLAAELDFKKTTGTQFIELRILADSKSQQPEFEFNVWN